MANTYKRHFSKCMFFGGVNQQQCDLTVSHSEILQQLMSYMLTKRDVLFFVVCSGDLKALKEKTLVLKEGMTFRLKIDFKVRWTDRVTEKRYGQRHSLINMNGFLCMCVWME